MNSLKAPPYKFLMRMAHKATGSYIDLCAFTREVVGFEAIDKIPKKDIPCYARKQIRRLRDDHRQI